MRRGEQRRRRRLPRTRPLRRRASGRRGGPKLAVRGRRTIRVETPNGPAWYRYNGDGEQGEGGEHPAGAPWSLDNEGQGRLWPIFTGERAEYALGGGRDDDANPTVIDLVTPEGVDQSGALAYAADERATIPYPSLEQ